MIQRITRALSLCILLFIPLHDIMAENLVARDSSNNTTDTLKNGFFHRFYRYFQQSNKVKEEKKFDYNEFQPFIDTKRNLTSGLSGAPTSQAIQNWESVSLHPAYTALTVKINPSPHRTFLSTETLRPRDSTF